MDTPRNLRLSMRMRSSISCRSSLKMKVSERMPARQADTMCVVYSGSTYKMLMKIKEENE